METYLLGHTAELIRRLPEPGEYAAVILSSDELEGSPPVPGTETVLHHTVPAKDVSVCKAEVRRDCLCGTVLTPRKTKEGRDIAFSYLITERRLVLCDDCGAVRSAAKRLAGEKQWQENGPGRFLYEILELLVIKDLHRLEDMEDRLGQLEDSVLAGSLDNFSTSLTKMRKETTAWFRYYSQLGDMVCELEENQLSFFTDNECRFFRMLEKRLGRLKDESQLLREYCLQVRELFQSEVDIRQNKIMKILTVVTTLCLPLSLVAGWYGMNFSNMPELGWRYGYLAVIAASLVIVALCIFVMKKKKFL